MPPARLASFRHAGCIAAMCMVLGVSAQNEEDALRIGYLRPGGTARSTGLANAFGAVGADGAAAGINPGGFGLYRSSELSLTPAFEVNGSTATHYGTAASDTQTRFFLNNVTLVLHSPSRQEEGAFRGGTFGLVYERQASHHWRSTVSGEAVPSTILQSFVNEAAGTPSGQLTTLFPFTAGLAWDTYGIDPLDTVAHTYISAIPFGTDTRQQWSQESSGSSRNTSVFYAANLLDKVYVGLSVGFAGYRLERTTTYLESSLDPGTDLGETTYEETLSATGTGLDVKTGAIVRITDRLRMGVAWHSPQWMEVSEAYATNMVTRFRSPDANGRTTYPASSPEGIFSYRLNTPWRLVLSGAYVAGQNGLVSVDYEYTDYRRMRFKPSAELVSEYDWSVENAAIVGSFRGVHTVRAGTEWRRGPWYYRLGWSFSPNAFVSTDPRHGQAAKTYAAGLGHRGEHFFVDLALNHTRGDGYRTLYDPATIASTRFDVRTFMVLLTLGLRT
jgi:hypothetical protein